MHSKECLKSGKSPPVFIKALKKKKIWILRIIVIALSSNPLNLCSPFAPNMCFGPILLCTGQIIQKYIKTNLYLSKKSN